MIFFLGDGMSVPTITAARILKGQLEGKTFGEEADLNFERFPNVAFAKVGVDLKAWTNSNLYWHWYFFYLSEIGWNCVADDDSGAKNNIFQLHICDFELDWKNKH